jgi:hypothetical protein
MSRQSEYRRDFEQEFRKLKLRHGSGPVIEGIPRSWAEGMTRKNARRIARKVVRTIRRWPA